MNKERYVGFVQGVAYSASLIKKYGSDAYEIIKESGIPSEHFQKYADKTDIEILEEELKN